MKSKEELNALKEEMETLNEKLAELTEDELTQITGGGPLFNVTTGGGPLFNVTVKADGVVKASGTINGQAYSGTSDLVMQ